MTTVIKIIKNQSIAKLLLLNILFRKQGILFHGRKHSFFLVPDTAWGGAGKREVSLPGGKEGKIVFPEA